MLDWNPQPPYTAEQLLQVIRILRDPETGCPWDKVQTHASIRKNFLEETCEALEAIDADDADMLREELGDVLMQVGFHTQIEQEAGRFTWQQVCDGVCRKLIDRHPHIFGGDTSIKDWDALKNKEKGRLTLQDDLASVPQALPALMRAEKIQKRASRAGMDYDSVADAFRDLRSEVDELEDAVKNGTPEQRGLELGDLLFSAVNVSRFIGADAEESLGLSCEKFVKRFAQVEKLARQRDIDMKTAGIQKLDEIWQEIKKSY